MRRALGLAALVLSGCVSAGERVGQGAGAGFVEWASSPDGAAKLDALSRAAGAAAATGAGEKLPGLLDTATSRIEAKLPDLIETAADKIESRAISLLERVEDRVRNAANAIPDIAERTAAVLPAAVERGLRETFESKRQELDARRAEGRLSWWEAIVLGAMNLVAALAALFGARRGARLGIERGLRARSRECNSGG